MYDSQFLTITLVSVVSQHGDVSSQSPTADESHPRCRCGSSPEKTPDQSTTPVPPEADSPTRAAPSPRATEKRFQRQRLTRPNPQWLRDGERVDAVPVASGQSP